MTYSVRIDDYSVRNDDRSAKDDHSVRDDYSVRDDHSVRILERSVRDVTTVRVTR
jgi:hypothetical protein